MTRVITSETVDAPPSDQRDEKGAQFSSLEAKPVPHRFAVNLAAVLGGQVACAALGLLIEVCFARFLGPEGRGQISLALMAVTLGVLAGGLGGEIPITVWAADQKKRLSEWFPAVLILGLVGCAAVICVWLLIYRQWHTLFLKGISLQLFILVLATIPVTVLFSYLSALLAGSEQFRARAALSLLEQSAGLIGILGFVVFFRRTAEMAVLGNLFGLLVGSTAAAYILRHSLMRFLSFSAARNQIVPALSLGTRGQFGNLASFFNYRLDVFLVNAFLNPAQVGLYAVGVAVSESLWQVPNAAAVVLLPRTARTMDVDATEFTCFITRQVVLVACVSGLLLGLVSPIAIPLVFGRAFSSSVAVIWWILPGTIALCLGKVISADLAGRRRPEYNSAFAFIALLVTIVLDVKLIPVMGIRGAALASSAAYFLDTALLAIALKYELKVGWRSLLVPSRSEFVPYRMAWLRFLSWIRPASISTAGGGSDNL